MKMKRITMRRCAVALIMLLVASGFATAGDGDRSSGWIYVPNAADGTISAIDTRGGRVLWRLTVSEGSNGRPAEAAHGIAISPDGSTLYAGDAATDELVIIDTGAREVIERVSISHGVHGIDISPDGSAVWVGGSDRDRFWLGQLSVVSTESRSVEAVVAPGVGSAAHVSFTPDGSRVWVASTTTNVVWVVDSAATSLSTVVPLIGDRQHDTRSPEGEAGYIGINEVAVSPDGSSAYAVGPESAILFRIDVATGEVTAQRQGEPRAHGVVVSPDGNEVWVANRSGSLSVFDAESLEPLANVPMGNYANHVAFDDGGEYVFATGESTVVVIDAQSRERVHTIETGREPHEIAVDRGRRTSD